METVTLKVDVVGVAPFASRVFTIEKIGGDSSRHRVVLTEAEARTIRYLLVDALAAEGVSG